jgi:cytochrome c oxidase cbb3-type subunit 1
MSAPSSPAIPETGAHGAACSVDGRATAAEIDASCRWPLLLLFTSSVCWLVFGTLLALIAAIKMHKGDFLADAAWLTLGRIRPASMNSFLYGFASQAGLGVMLWLLCRLGRVTLHFQWPALVAWKLWNIGVTIGVIAILAGASTGFEWLEMPRAAAGILFAAYVIIGLSAVATFVMRRECEVYPSQWYLLAALFWFPWIYSAANYLLVLDPVRGTLQAAVNGWFTGNFAGLWLTPLGLAGIFYFLPRQCEQPLHSRELAAYGFWTLAFFTNFSGLTGLIGGPVPRWMPAVSTAANVCLLVAVLSNGLNWHLTCRAACAGGSCKEWKKDFALCFVLFGALSYLVHGLAVTIMALPQVAAVTNFTYLTVARNHLLLHGFVGMVLFGCLYYIIPQLVRVKWPNEKWIRVHLLCSLIGVALLFLGLGLGGVLQGWRLADASVPFLNVMRGTIPFVGLSTLGVLLLLVGQLAFVANLAGLLRAFLAPLCQAFCADCCGWVPAAKAGVKS